MDGFMRALVSVWTDSGFAHLSIENVIMIGVGLVLLYLAIAKQYEPLLLLPIASWQTSRTPDSKTKWAS